MTNKELFDIIKIVNNISDELVLMDMEKEGKRYAELSESLNGYLDLITYESPRWKYYKAYSLKYSSKTNHYWIQFNN